MISVFEREDKTYLLGYIFFKFIVYLPKKRVLGHQQAAENYHGQVFKWTENFALNISNIPRN